MQALVQDTYGSAEVMELRNIDKPQIGDYEVLVGVRAAGVNPADWAVMSGLPYIARPVYGLRKPKVGVRGTDVAGVVESVVSIIVEPHVHSPGELVVVVAKCPSTAPHSVVIAK